MRSGWIHGGAVDKKTRTVRYLSSSALQLADDTTDKGCLRKWYYAYVEGRKEPPTDAQAAGTRDHECVERYLLTGQRVFSPRVAKGIHMLPPPMAAGMEVEHDLIPYLEDDDGREISGLHLAPLRAAGIAIVGRIDLMHDLGINYGGDSVEDTRDPDGTVEVFDHKFVRTLDYALKGPDLLKNIQMVAYGEYVFRVVPGVTHVRLSHGYYPTNGNARKSTILTKRDPLSRFWMEHVEPLARSIADAAQHPTADTVRPNRNACKAFNRLCMHAEYCSAGSQVGLAELAGQTASKALIAALTNPKPTNTPLIPAKSLLAKIQQPAANDNAAREAELAKLKEEEHSAKLATLPPYLLESISKIELIASRNTLGWPKVQGKAAEAFTLLTGQTRGPVGALEDVEVTEVTDFDNLLNELVERFGDVEVPPPAPATVPVAGLLPDDAPGAVAAPPPAPLAEIAKEAEKPKKTRTTKAKAKEPEVETAPPPAPPAGPEQGLAPGDVMAMKPANDNKAINLMVDVITEGGQVQNLAPIVDIMAAAIAKQFGLDDCRAGGADSPVGYGKWKAVLSAMVRAAVVEGHIVPGTTYRIDARGNEIYEEAVQAMRQVVRMSGGQYVRGVR